jgi:hypothetical protein
MATFEPAHLESCTSLHDRANWYVPVRTGMYLHKEVHGGTRRYMISLFGTDLYKSVQVSTRFLGFGSGRYK